MPTVDPASITNWIEKTNTVMDWVKTQLEGDTSYYLSNFPGSNIAQLWDYVEKHASPGVITMYQKSEYGDIPRRKGAFSVIVSARHPRRKDVADAAVADLMDKVISYLDHKVYNQLLCRVAFDQGHDFGPRSEVNAMEIGFRFDDH